MLGRANTNYSQKYFLKYFFIIEQLIKLQYIEITNYLKC